LAATSASEFYQLNQYRSGRRVRPKAAPVERQVRAAAADQPIEKAHLEQLVSPIGSEGTIWAAGLRFNALTEVLNCVLHTSFVVGNTQGTERHLNDAERAEHHRSINVAHVSDTEGLALHFTKTRAQNDAALGK
jgi:hypothetical protein